jgi:hypothetical protein
MFNRNPSRARFSVPVGSITVCIHIYVCKVLVSECHDIFR